MTVLTRAQFVQALETVNKFTYLGGPSKVRTRSSMLPVVNAVAAYNAPGGDTGANLMALIQAIGAVPAVKILKYGNALALLYRSYPTPLYVQVNAGGISLSRAPVPGIGLPLSQAVPSHQTDVVLALLQLDAVPVGHQLLLDICAEIANGHRCGIADAANTFSGGNECAGLAPHSNVFRTNLGDALAGQYAAVGQAIGAAMTALGHAPPVGYNWLVQQINAMPIPNLVGVPSAIASSAVHGANWISAATLTGWVTNATVFPAPLAANRVNDAIVVIGSVLHGGATPSGVGIRHTRVHWNASNLNAAGVARPAYVGLAHELIHALHNQRGDQPGMDNNHVTTVLYEYLCVGLGAFAAAPRTENAVRAGAGLVLRPRYG